MIMNVFGLGVEFLLLVATAFYIARLLFVSYQSPVSFFGGDSADVKRSLLNQHIMPRAS